ncbi:MAG: dihydrolipoamide acetyltransferase family protein [Syntrophorhabdales bacterium]|jgi:pyruvate dehydrogenase E2 component (dihydrolipoamide acetyltransferase)/2-oxoglutarate dehydrogenase E2 component (dihydrolipoamide succinyltransferase)
MATPIVVPKLGLATDDATIVEWKAKEGDWVERGEVVAVLETQKVEWNVEAEDSGYLHIILVQGEKAAVGSVMGILAESREELDKLAVSMAPVPDSLTRAEAPSPDVAGSRATQAEVSDRIKITPVARKMAEEKMLDITRIKGTGPGGRITADDVEKAAEEREGQQRVPEKGAGVFFQGKTIRQSIPMKGMRKAIADHMVRSLATAAQLTFLGEADMTEIVKLREVFKKKQGPVVQKITYTEMLVAVLARTLKDHPDINCSIVDNELKIWEDINIGVAVALGNEGLLVPVVRHADTLSITEISVKVKELVEKARTGRLVPDDMAGGTFTITAVGPIGVSLFFTPIINQPECAIMGTGPIMDKPVVRKGEIVAAPIMTYSFTTDHRAINGYGAEQFMRTFQETIETPGLLML